MTKILFDLYIFSREATLHMILVRFILGAYNPYQKFHQNNLYKHLNIARKCQFKNFRIFPNISFESCWKIIVYLETKHHCMYSIRYRIKKVLYILKKSVLRSYGKSILYDKLCRSRRILVIKDYRYFRSYIMFRYRYLQSMLQRLDVDSDNSLFISWDFLHSKPLKNT